MSSLKKVERVQLVKGGSIPETTLKIPMPAGAKPPPPAPTAVKPSGDKRT
jgi:hypothetical protein